jgi:hypothetical protein
MKRPSHFHCEGWRSKRSVEASFVERGDMVGCGCSLVFAGGRLCNESGVCFNEVVSFERAVQCSQADESEKQGGVPKSL